ncbi:MAG: flagellar motor switch protein [Methanomassiliicoccales archaeon PtaU1.Bin124]|nr:MAG: flagellar motor switch protein [Methanomassiliicoccales archaeon PtaU1.Bin124]
MENEAVSEPNFTEMQLDALKELGNIGASHASTALTNLIKRDVMIDVPDCFVCKVEKLPDAFGDKNKMVVSAYFDAIGPKTGHIIMILPVDMSMILTDMITGTEHVAGREFTEDDKEMAAEIGNILVSAYLSSIGDFANVMLLPSPPSMAIDMLGAIMQMPAQMAAQNYDYVVVIKTEFKYEGDSFPGFMLYIPDPDTQKILMTKFGIE